MRFFDWLVVIVMGVVGWLVVSFLLNRSKPRDDNDADPNARDATFDNPYSMRPPSTSDQSAPGAPVPVPAPVARLPGPRPTDTPDLARADDGADLLSLDEIGRRWNAILGVPSDASGAVIEQAYHAKLAECDRVRFDSNASAASRRQAEQLRARVSQAYEFIRPSRP